MICKMTEMPKTFQIEFPYSKSFQARLAALVDTFSSIADHSVSVKTAVGLCLQALPDITPALIDAYFSSETDAQTEAKDSSDAADIFQRTTNLDSEERARLEAVKLNLLLKHKRDISRRDIMLGIIYTASELKNADIAYIYSEYQ